MLDKRKLSKAVKDKYSFANETFFHTAKAHLKDRIEVEIGDSKQPDFKPQVKVQRWDNEVNLSFRLKDDGLEQEVVDTVSDKIVWKKGKREAHFYDIQSAKHPEGAYEFEVVLLEKPSSNVVEFTIQDKDVEYLYQPALTPEEIADGSERPENVVGSYAIYTKTPKTNYVGENEYKVGKVGHIYRPRIEDSVGSWVWGELHIENGILSVTIPQDFLDNAVYPVKHAAGLTFGYTSNGATDWLYSGATRGSKFTLSEAATVTSISAYGYYTVGGNPGIRNGVYADGPGTLQLGTTMATPPGSVGWNTISTFEDTQVFHEPASYTSEYSLGTDTTRIRAQKFTAVSSKNVTVVRVMLAKVGSPTNNVSAKIYSDSSGSPGSALATSTNSFTGTDLSTTPAEVTFNFSGYSLTPGTAYWIVLYVDSGWGSTDYYTWRSVTASGTAYETVKIYNGTDWNGTTGAKGMYFSMFSQSNVSLAAGDYYLSSVVTGSNGYLRYDAGSTNQAYRKTPSVSFIWAKLIYDSTTPDATYNYKLSIYATYTASGGSDPTPLRMLMGMGT